MSNPKRKVTDLLPSEAILISSDAERDAIMKLFDKEMGVFIKKHYLPKYPFYLRLKRNPIILWTHERLWLNTLVIPATDFIPTESDEVEVSDTVLLSEVRNKLTPIKNLIAMLENGLVKGSVEIHDLVLKEIEQCKINIEELTRNTQNQ